MVQTVRSGYRKTYVHTFSTTANATNPLYELKGAAATALRVSRITITNEDPATGMRVLVQRRSTACAAGTALAGTANEGMLDFKDVGITTKGVGQKAMAGNGGTVVHQLATEWVGPNGKMDRIYAHANSPEIVLRGVADFLTINASAALAYSATIELQEWSEE